MPLNKSRGNMYKWCSHTWNVIKGECPHDCIYCYCKKWGKQSPLHFDNKELETDLGSGNFIFVGSSCDMWAEGVKDAWILRVLIKCNRTQNNRYLFQSKNPARFEQFVFPANRILGTTIETNRDCSKFSKAPNPEQRMEAMRLLPSPTMVSIEPVMDFDLDIMLRWIDGIKPEFVSIGADSRGCHLPEPSPEKLQALIGGLKGITEVKLKSNLGRLFMAEREQLIDQIVSIMEAK